MKQNKKLRIPMNLQFFAAPAGGGEVATKKDKALSSTYITKDALNLRDGAGTGKKVLVTMPAGTQVNNYGYYTPVGDVKWLYVQTTINGVVYTGFCSMEWLSGNSTSSNKIKYTEALRQAMNAAYKCGLKATGVIDDAIKKQIDKHYLYYKTPTIRNAHVSWLQDTLKHLGYAIVVDGSYGPATRKVVMQFQRDHGLVADGYAGVNTHLKLLALV